MSSIAPEFNQSQFPFINQAENQKQCKARLDRLTRLYETTLVNNEIRSFQSIFDSTIKISSSLSYDENQGLYGYENVSILTSLANISSELSTSSKAEVFSILNEFISNSDYDLQFFLNQTGAIGEKFCSNYSELNNTPEAIELMLGAMLRLYKNPEGKEFTEDMLKKQIVSCAEQYNLHAAAIKADSEISKKIVKKYIPSKCQNLITAIRLTLLGDEPRNFTQAQAQLTIASAVMFFPIIITTYIGTILSNHPLDPLQIFCYAIIFELLIFGSLFGYEKYQSIPRAFPPFENITEQAKCGYINKVEGIEITLEKILNTLLSKNTPLLEGPAGAGKTTLINGVAWQISHGELPEKFKDKFGNKKVFTVVSSDLLPASVLHPDPFEETIKRMEKYKDDLILVIDEAHTLFQQKPNHMKKLLEDSGFPFVILISTKEESEKYIKGEAPHLRRIFPIQLDAADEEGTVRILNAVAKREAPEIIINPDHLKEVFRKTTQHFKKLNQPAISKQIFTHSISLVRSNSKFIQAREQSFEAREKSSKIAHQLGDSWSIDIPSTQSLISQLATLDAQVKKNESNENQVKIQVEELELVQETLKNSENHLLQIMLKIAKLYETSIGKKRTLTERLLQGNEVGCLKTLMMEYCFLKGYRVNFLIKRLNGLKNALKLELTSEIIDQAIESDKRKSEEFVLKSDPEPIKELNFKDKLSDLFSNPKPSNDKENSTKTAIVVNDNITTKEITIQQHEQSAPSVDVTKAVKQETVIDLLNLDMITEHKPQSTTHTSGLSKGLFIPLPNRGLTCHVAAALTFFANFGGLVMTLNKKEPSLSDLKGIDIFANYSSTASYTLLLSNLLTEQMLTEQSSNLIDKYDRFLTLHQLKARALVPDYNVKKMEDVVDDLETLINAIPLTRDLVTPAIQRIRIFPTNSYYFKRIPKPGLSEDEIIPYLGRSFQFEKNRSEIECKKPICSADAFFRLNPTQKCEISIQELVDSEFLIRKDDIEISTITGFPEVNRRCEYIRTSDNVYYEIRAKESYNPRPLVQYSFVKKPDILMIQYKRFDQKGKLHTSITNTDLTIEGSQYVLKSVIHHKGENGKSGHYVTVNKENGGWVIYDDLQSQSISLTQKEAAEYIAKGYIFGYEMVTSPS